MRGSSLAARVARIFVVAWFGRIGSVRTVRATFTLRVLSRGWGMLFVWIVWSGACVSRRGGEKMSKENEFSANERALLAEHAALKEIERLFGEVVALAAQRRVEIEARLIRGGCGAGEIEGD